MTDHDTCLRPRGRRRADRRRRLAGIGLAISLAAGLGPLAAQMTAPAVAVEAGTLTSAGPDPVMNNEQIVLDGSLPPARSRAVTLQRRLDGGAWTTVRSQTSRSNGSFTFTVNAPGAGTTDVGYRVVAPAATIAGTSYPAFETPPVTRGLTAQASWLDAPARILSGTPFTLAASFHPARAGRTVVLQRRNGTQWSQIATSTQNASGAVSFARPATTTLGLSEYRVVAQNYRQSAVATSNVVGVRVVASGDVTPPAVPTGPAGTLDQDLAAADLTWNAVTGAGLAGYRVYRGITATGPWTRLTPTPVASTSYRDPGATATAPWYAVTSIDTAGNESARSASVRPEPLPPDTTPPPAPTGLSAVPGEGEVELSWDAVGEDVVGYRVFQASSADGPWTMVSEDIVPGTSTTVGGLTSGTTYWFAVTALDEAGNSSERSAPVDAALADDTAPAVPQNLSARPQDGAADLSWDAVADADLAGYQVYVATGPDGPWAEHGDRVTGTSATVGGLTNGTEYWFSVAAVDARGNTSARSGPDQATPQDSTAPAAPRNVVAAGHDARVTITWEPVAAADLAGYRVERATAETGAYARVHDDVNSGTELVDTDVRNGTTYWYRVLAVDQRGNVSEPSAADSATPDGPQTNQVRPVVSEVDRHACTVRSDGTIWCWGAGAGGALGDGEGVDRLRPVQVGDDSDWTDVDLAPGGTCALKVDQTMWCWGNDMAGGQQRLTPQRQGTDADWTSIDGSFVHACALKRDHTLWCWGQNFRGPLGDGTQDNRYTIGQVGTDHDWAQVFAGYFRTCATKLDGSLWCWGDNYYGGVGVGSDAEAVLVPTRVGDATDWTSASPGVGFTCGTRAGGALYCWGADYGWMPGDELENPVPVRIGTDTDWRSVSAGSTADVCGIREDSTAWCWGRNEVGQLGDGSTVDRVTPQQVAGPVTSWSQIQVGSQSACGVAVGGAVRCWGFNLYGQLGDGYSRRVALPTTPEDDPGGWRQVALSDNAFCGVDLAGRTSCRGSGTSYGPLGDGSTGNRQALGPIAGDLALVSLTMGQSHACGLERNGAGWCWGSNGNSALGSTENPGGTPVRIEGDREWASLSAGSSHTCGVTTDATLWCWGANWSGQLGIGSIGGTSATPVRVGAPGEWAGVAAGSLHTCGVKQDGSLWCWGTNQSSQLGQGSSGSVVSSPVRVGSGDDWVSVAAGTSNTCGIRLDGSAWCWGTNGSGQVGSGSTAYVAHTPEPVASEASWSKLTVGGSHVCGVTDDGSLWCWGRDYYTGTGTGSGSGWETVSSVPVRIGADRSWSDVDASSRGTCAVDRAGASACWGDNIYGELGLPSYRTTPWETLS